jgi:DNA modification methylase
VFERTARYLARRAALFVAADWWRILAAVGWQYRSSIICNEGSIYRRTAWGSFGSANAPHVIAPVEVVLVAHKGNWNRDRRGERGDVVDADFIKWTNGLWTIGNHPHAWHPRAFPAELASRPVQLYSFPCDLVLDPFCGAPTAPIEAFSLGRRAYGFDISAEYVLRARVDAAKLNNQTSGRRVVHAFRCRPDCVRQAPRRLRYDGVGDALG